MREKEAIAGNVKALLDRIDDYSLPPERFLNRCYGRGSWKYDPYTSCYIVADDHHRGPGRGFIILDHDLKHSEYVLPDLQVN